MSEKFEFRNVFNQNSVEFTATNIKNVHNDFLHVEFISDVMEGFNALSFGDRCSKICTNLYKYLPKEYPTTIEILVDSLGEELQVEELEGYEGFYVMPLCEYVATYGLEHFDISMNAMFEMTKRFSAEFSIRYFLKAQENKTLQQLSLWAKDENVHVRRLVSEGSRPRLPLAMRLHSFVQEPTPVLELLELLKNEPSRLVQRSIANNLNDIAKDNPDACVALLKRWKKEKVVDIDYIIKHATRTLIKEGHAGALELLGFNDVHINNFALHVKQNSVVLGESLEFDVEFEIESAHDEKLVIDYLLYFKKANGSLSSKVFKLRTKSFKSNEIITLHKSHPLKEASTRKYYEGEHQIAIQINGKLYSPTKSFTLLLS